ncbi:class I SAM-dependent methyltransferase [Planctomycetota bacterium]
MSLRDTVKKIPLARRLYARWRQVTAPRRRRQSAYGYLRQKRQAVERWLNESNEDTNLTYDLTELNIKYLATFLAAVTDAPVGKARSYLDEILGDQELAQHIARATGRADRDLRAVSDPVARYGRRIGWYAVARLVKPRVVVETGVDKGIGACVLTAALRRNVGEGHEGRYFGTDINPRAGWLLGEPYAQFGEILYGDSLESLRRLERMIDLFINDSCHSKEYERAEYDLVATKLSEKGIVLGDNAHCTAELYEFAQRANRRFLYFQECPQDHWYPGGGIGVAF